MISVVIPVFNAVHTLDRCLGALSASEYADYECIVVDDGSQDSSPQIAAGYAARCLAVPNGPKGPANARNIGAAQAEGEIVFFLDADVVVYPDTLTKVADTFCKNPEVDAMFGSYDESPGDGDFLSQYKNLFHHFVHQQARQEGGTFWSGCGAIRREVFLQAGGFDVRRYARPSIEDIELGCRLKSSGHQILLNKQVQVKHLKRWTLTGLIKTDVIDRGIPWTILIMQDRSLPNDLNLSVTQRLSAFLLVLMLALIGLNVLVSSPSWLLVPLLGILFMILISHWHLHLGLVPSDVSRPEELFVYLLIGTISLLAVLFQRTLILIPVALSLLLLLFNHLQAKPSVWVSNVLLASSSASLVAGSVWLFSGYSLWAVLPVLITLGVIIILNQKFYRFFFRKRGLLFTIAVLPYHMLYYFYSLFALVAGGAIYLWDSSFKARFN